MKTRQSAKIRELGEALVAVGLCTLDNQSQALGLSRSTTWTILQGNHKGSGLSAAIINRIFASRSLPPLVRAKIVEYVKEKSSGGYGHSEALRRKFVARLSVKVDQQNAVTPRARLRIVGPSASELYRRPKAIAGGLARGTRKLKRST